jgi:predicted glycosyltransferase involved in capsule biosynthesis
MHGPPLLVPWRPDGGRRDELWAFCRRWWSDFEIIEGSSDDGPFRRAQAINRAAACTDADVFAVIDADVVADAQQVRQAAKMARETRRVVFAFTQYYALNIATTAAVLEGRADLLARTDDRRRGARWWTDRHESSIVVIPRTVWDTVGGFDERFVGWGQEDVAFAHSARLLTGEPERVDGPVYHLWHRRSSERSRKLENWRRNQALGERYRSASTAAELREIRA